MGAPAGGFPRLYAAASLKHELGLHVQGGDEGGFPRLYAAASLKLRPDLRGGRDVGQVFRGFMPRPH